MPVQINKNLVVTVAVVALVGAIGLGYAYNKKQEADEKQAFQQTAEKAVSFVNGNLLAEGLTASLNGVEEVSGILKIGLKVGEQEYSSYITKDGKIFFVEGYDIGKIEGDKASTSESVTTVGNFTVNNEEVCKEDGKPIVYFFGSTSCPHCQWEKPILEAVMKNFEDQISFRSRMDSQDDLDVLYKYSDGGIPTLVFGCKYSRVGSGESEGDAAETKNLTALLCKLTDNNPSGVCSEVQDLVNQIK